MYLKVTLAITGILLLLIAGCPKNQSAGNGATSSGNVEEVAPRTAEGSKEPEEAAADEGANLSNEVQLSDEEKEIVRTALLDAAANLGLTYDSGTDALSGKGIPEEGSSIPDLISRTAQVLKASNVAIESRTITKIAQSMVADLIPPPETVKPAPRDEKGVDDSEPPSKGQQKSDVAAGSQQIDRTKLKIAKQLIGDWKSTKEIHTRFTAQHSADYFEFLNISPDNKIMFKRYRDGEMISDRLFSFTFDEGKGRLSLKDDSGDVVNTLTAYNMGDDDTILYLEFKSGTITVYNQVSRVGVPLTEEEKAGVAQPGIGEK